MPVREQVVREALADASAYHVGGLRCDHLGEGALQPRVVFAASTTLCEYCTVQLMRGEGLEMPDDPPCDVCGAEVPVFVVKTQLSAEENAALYVACCCADCLRWWPTAHADIVSASASVGPRPVA